MELNYYKRPLDKRLNDGMLKEAHEFLRKLYGANGSTNVSDLMEISATKSGAYLINELKISKFVGPGDSEGKISLTQEGIDYVNINKLLKIKTPEQPKNEDPVKEVIKELAGV